MPELPPLATWLLRTDTYPHRPKDVKLVQTQMSFVFLAGEYVYKVKKPVNLGYLDYTTLEKRRFFCQQELELNQRLAPETYLAVVPVTRGGAGFRLGGDGVAVEYAVKMRSLPAERMMNTLLLADEVTADMLTKLADRLVQFHKAARTSPDIGAFGRLEAVRVNTDENFAQTVKYIGVTITAEQHRRIADYTDGFLSGNSALFGERVKTGRIRDCHGDLHAAHICFTDGVQVYDCIEFNDRFRYCDVASEIAFLAMDLDRYGRADLSREFVNAYMSASGDAGIRRLLGFYKCYRAYVRGKVEGFRFDDPYIGAEAKKAAREAARGYYALAGRYIRGKPVLVVTAGLMGTGKTTVAEAVGRKVGPVVISADVVRKRLAGVPLTEHRYDEFSGGIYSPEFSRKTYDVMFDEASQALARGESVILDASFKKRDDRLRAQQVAERAGADSFVIECVLDEATIRQRLERRQHAGTAVSDGRWGLLDAQRGDFDTIAEFSKASHIIVDTSRPLEEITDLIMERIWQ